MNFVLEFWSSNCNIFKLQYLHIVIFENCNMQYMGDPCIYSHSKVAFCDSHVVWECRWGTWVNYYMRPSVLRCQAMSFWCPGYLSLVTSIFVLWVLTMMRPESIQLCSTVVCQSKYICHWILLSIVNLWCWDIFWNWWQKLALIRNCNTKELFGTKIIGKSLKYGRPSQQAFWRYASPSPNHRVMIQLNCSGNMVGGFNI